MSKLIFISKMSGPWANEYKPNISFELPSSESDYSTDESVTIETPKNKKIYKTKIMKESKSSYSNKRYIKISEASNFLPIFDGKNIPVTTFIRKCKNTLSLINSKDRYIFSKLIRSKITGNADIFIGDKPIDDLNQLFSELKNPQWQLDLANIIQKPGESAFDYGVRTTEILQKLIESIKENFKIESAEGMIKRMKESAIHSFSRGLAERLNSNLIQRKFDILQDMINAGALLR